MVGPRPRSKRSKLKAQMMDRDAPVEERFEASMKLAGNCRATAARGTRVQLRCEITGRSRVRTIANSSFAASPFASLASSGQIPGMVKASW